MGFHYPWKGFSTKNIVDERKSLLLNPPYKVNGLEEDGMLVDWNFLPIELPHPTKGLLMIAAM
jgi:hypothetical protein